MDQDASLILQVHEITTGYGTREVLSRVSLDVAFGEVVIVTGGNGSGKSTLLKAIFGLLRIWNTDGYVKYREDGTKTLLPVGDPASNTGRRMAYLPQRAVGIPGFTGEESWRFAAGASGSSESHSVRSSNLLQALPSLQPLQHRRTDSFSGGEQRLTTVGMMYATRPKLLLLDEPIAGLSSTTAEQMVKFLFDWHKAESIAMVIVEHRVGALSKLRARHVHCEGGRLKT